MITRTAQRLSMRALVVDDELSLPTAEGRAARALVQELQSRAIEIVEASSAEDGASVLVSDSAIHVILIDWSLGGDKEWDQAKLEEERCGSLLAVARGSIAPPRLVILRLQRRRRRCAAAGARRQGGDVRLAAACRSSRPTA